MPSIEKQLVESSRSLTDIVIAGIGADQDKFDELMELVYRDEHPISMRAAWAAYLITEKHPKLAKHHINRLIKILPNAKVDGVKRSALKIVFDTPYEISEDLYGELADTVFNFAQDPKQAIAIRAFSIDILMNVIKTYPEIAPEVLAILESIMPDGSRGLKNKCSKLIKRLRKEYKL